MVLVHLPDDQQRVHHDPGVGGREPDVSGSLKRRPERAPHRDHGGQPHLFRRQEIRTDQVAAVVKAERAYGRVPTLIIRGTFLEPGDFAAVYSEANAPGSSTWSLQPLTWRKP